MRRVSIFTTSRTAAFFDPFVHDGIEYRFGLLTCEGPVQLVEGTPKVFVDWVLEQCSGLELVRRLRLDQRFVCAHITMVLDEGDEELRRRALRVGADDYAVGPLDRQAMLDRVMALSGESLTENGGERLIVLGDLEINESSQLARWRGKPVPLRPNELRALRFLATNPDRIFTRQQLIEALGKEGDPNCLRTVDVWIKRLRQGLRKAGAGQLLRTVHGLGYVLDRPKPLKEVGD